jgi:hypothetical protein
VLVVAASTTASAGAAPDSGDRIGPALDPALDVLDEHQSCGQEALPVVLVGVAHSLTAVEQREEPLGQDVAELLPPRPFRLANGSYDRWIAVPT